VPFHTNVYLPPLATPKRCASLGREIARIIALRPERVAIIASGGMSHFPGTWKYLHPEFEFDRWMIGELERGNADALLELTVEQLDEVGNTELLTWAILLGAIGEQPGELLHYTPTWHHGHAMMRFLPAREKMAAAGAGRQAYSRYAFKNADFEFYKHPPASAYKLNKLLFDVRHDSDLCLRLLNDLDGVAGEWGLNDEEKEATRAIASVGGNAKISDSAAALVKAGAHPLQALMSLHAVHGEFTRLQQEAAKRK
jgi:2,3-dihydroxyphenylpropionate 1,2-dioxygenase